MASTAMLCRLVLLSAALLAPGSALAASCTVSAVGMNFGSYAGSASYPGPTPITVNCTSGASYSVGVNGGNNSGGSFYTWNMAGPGSSQLGYTLYKDSSRSSYLGNSPGYDTIAGTGTGANQTVYIYSAAPANTSVVPGTYNDSVTVSVFVSGGSTVTATMPVTATVNDACSLSTLPLAFGTYAMAQLDAATTISVTCTNSTSYNVGLDNGLYGGRRLGGPAASRLPYLLYRDAARTQSWGTTIGTNTATGTGTGTAQPLTVYGRIQANQFKNPGSYSDTVTVTVTY